MGASLDAPILNTPTRSPKTQSLEPKRDTQMRAEFPENRDRRHLENGMQNQTPDWSEKWPLGIITPLACQIVEAWFNAEDPTVIQAITDQLVTYPGSDVALHAVPPTSRSPWRIQYRVCDFTRGEPTPYRGPEQIHRHLSSEADEIADDIEDDLHEW